VADLLGLDMKVPREAVLSFGEYWRPKYSVPNPMPWWRRCRCWRAPRRSCSDPVYTGKIMAGLIGLSRQGYFKPMKTCCSCTRAALPSLHVYEAQLLGSGVVTEILIAEGEPVADDQVVVHLD
jgi:D-cysteine desulfhydrase